MRDLIKETLIIIMICRWKLNSLIGAEFYTYAQIQTLRNGRPVSVIWGLTFREPLKFGSLYIHFPQINSSLTWDFPVLEPRLLGLKGS